MSEEQIPLGISAEDWAATPRAVKALVLSLLETVAALQKRVAELEERVNQNSRNSSKPPSSDTPNAPPPPKHTPSGRKAGGQPGHPGHGRALKPVAEVNHLVIAKPLACGTCGALLLGEDPHPVRHQVTELPRMEPEVTEYQQHTLTCLACGAPTRAPWPTQMPSGSWGPRTQATVGYFTGRLGVSQRDVAELLETVFHTDLSLGSIPAVEAEVSAALATPVTAGVEYVQAQPRNNVDETSWPLGSHRGWLWANVTTFVTVFFLLPSRSAAAARQVIGALNDKIVGSDRYSAYTWMAVWLRQVCWAHLRRDFQAIAERGGESARVGQALLAQAEPLFTLWHRVRAGPLSRAEFQVQVQPLRQRVGELLREGVQVAHPKTAATCAKILQVEAALWTFVDHEGVEPTNNAAERALRRAVLWRRRSFGTQSESGSRFVERILTAVTTLRQQHRDVLDFLTDACAAAIAKRPAPSLLPNTQPVIS